MTLINRYVLKTGLYAILFDLALAYLVGKLWNGADPVRYGLYFLCFLWIVQTLIFLKVQAIASTAYRLFGKRDRISILKQEFEKNGFPKSFDDDLGGYGYYDDVNIYLEGVICARELPARTRLAAATLSGSRSTVSTFSIIESWRLEGALKKALQEYSRDRGAVYHPALDEPFLEDSWENRTSPPPL